MPEKEHDTTLRLRPGMPAFWRGARNYFLLTVPLFILLYALTWGSSGLWLVLVAHAALALCGLLGAVLYARTRFCVTEDAIYERGFLGALTRTPREEVDRIVIVELRRSLVATPVMQLFMVDHHERVRARMRGEYWAPEAMLALARAVGAPLLRPEQPLTLDDLQRNHPEMLYGFERSPFRHA